MLFSKPNYRGTFPQHLLTFPTKSWLCFVFSHIVAVMFTVYKVQEMSWGTLTRWKIMQVFFIIKCYRSMKKIVQSNICRLFLCPFIRAEDIFLRTFLTLWFVNKVVTLQWLFWTIFDDVVRQNFRKIRLIMFKMLSCNKRNNSLAMLTRNILENTRGIMFWQRKISGMTFLKCCDV